MKTITLTEEQAQQIEEVLSGMLHGTDWNNGTHAKIYRPKFPEALATIRAARAQAGHSGEATEMVQEPVAWMTRNVPVTPNWKSTVNSSETALYCKPLYAAPVPVTTPDVCGEVCARAKLCYGCNKDLEEANAKYAEQAEQEPVAEVVLRNQSVGFGRTEERKDIQFLVDVEVGAKLYAAPVRTKDLTSEDIDDAYEAAGKKFKSWQQSVHGQMMSEHDFFVTYFAHELITKYKEINK